MREEVEQIGTAVAVTQHDALAREQQRQLPVDRPPQGAAERPPANPGMVSDSVAEAAIDR